MIWAWCAACCAGMAVWMATRPGCERMVACRGADSRGRATTTLVMAMLAVVVRQGASIPQALREVGSVLGDAFGDGLCRVAEGLSRGISWDEAWVVVCSDEHDDANRYRAIRDALEDAWLHGASPVERLSAAIDALDGRGRSAIERHAARLSVRLLMPTGLCFLPAFVCIGVIPSIVSFL